MVRFEKSKLWEAEMKNVLDKASPLQEDHFSCADSQICSQSQYKWKVRAISHLLPAQVWHMTSAATQKPCQDFRTFNSVHFSSVTQLCQNFCDFMECSTPGLPVHHQPPESNKTHVHWVRDAIQPSDPLSFPFSSCLESFPESGSLPRSQFFAIRWPKFCSFSFSISPSNEYSVLISFRIDWLDRLAVQETLKCLIQHHSSKASILRCSAFFIVQLSHPSMTTGKTIALTKQTFVGKVMFLLFNMLSQFSSVVTLWTAAHQVSLSIANSWRLFKLMSIELVMPSNHLILCHPLILSPSNFPSIRVFSNELVLCIR